MTNSQNLPPPIEVSDLREPYNPRRLFYSADVGPRKAVLCAHAQEVCNDWNTWDYEKKYGHLIVEGKLTIACGDFCTLKEQGATTMPAKINLDPTQRTVAPKEKPAELPKRPRGRPRKNSAVSPVDQPPTKEISVVEVEEKVENVLPKKPQPKPLWVKRPEPPVPTEEKIEDTPIHKPVENPPDSPVKKPGEIPADRPTEKPETPEKFTFNINKYILTDDDIL